jgi:hypothetical protein
MESGEGNGPTKKKKEEEEKKKIKKIEPNQKIYP